MPTTEFFRLRASLRLLQDRNDRLFCESFALHALLLMKQTLLPFGTNLGGQVAIKKGARRAPGIVTLLKLIARTVRSHPLSRAVPSSAMVMIAPPNCVPFSGC